MEGKYLGDSSLRLLYQRLGQRFDDDLSDERDVLLSRCACLMLLKFMREDGIGVHYGVRNS
jgi:hypothetical protein